MHLLTARELRTRFLKGELTAEAITKYFLERIDRLDGQIGAFLTVFHQGALERARQLDAKKARGEPLGKLAAVPVAIKDNIHVTGELTTCGSRFLTNYRAPFSATVTHLLEREDAILIGKTNCDEFAMGSSTEHSALQKTVNPWDLSRVPGGSSGGSAAAVAARLCPIALGTDTGGSIRQPAALCGIVGFKPTYGRVSRYGLVAYGSSLDQIGPMTTNVGDAALTMEILGRQCEHDATSLALSPEEYLNKCSEDIAGLRIGVPNHLLESLRVDVRNSFEKGLEQLKQAGAVLVDIDFSLFKHALSVYYILATAEASTNLARFDGIRYGQRAADADTLDAVYDRSKEEGFGPEVKRRIMLGTYVLSAGYQDAYYKKAQQVRTLMMRRCRELFQVCDLIATPVAPGPAFQLGAVTDPLEMYLADIYTIPANLCGLPAVSIPTSMSSEGLPLGLQLMGPQKHDGLVLQVAHALESATCQNAQLPAVAR
jgi:aspartyl-tRNA(Asn)/glutamyl-tRNA(Gln) amidotransferase subunit A